MLNNITGAIWIGSSQLVLLSANFLLLKLLTSHLSIESFGFYSLCMTIVLFARQVIYDPISIVVAKECASSANDPRRLIYWMSVVRFVTDRFALSLLVFGTLTFIFAIAAIENYTRGIVISSCLAYLAANGAQGIYFNVLNSITDRKSAALFSMLDSVLKLFFVFLALQFIGSEIATALFSIAVGSFFVLLAVRSSIRNRIKFGGAAPKRLNVLVRRSLMMSIPLLLPSGLAAFKSVVDRWILAAFVGVDELAVYSVLLQLGYFPMILFIGVIQTFVGPRVYGFSAHNSECGFDDLKRFVHKILFWVLILACAAGGIAIGLSDFVFKLLVGEEYRVFSIYLPLFVFSGALAAAAGILHLAAIAVFKTSVVGKLMITSLALAVALASFSIIGWGFVGAVMALMIASATTAFIYWAALYNAPFGRS